MVIEVEGERFAVVSREAGEDVRVVDFTWLNGPADGTYGFTVSGLPLDRIEAEAARFVRAFFAEDGIGPAAFPEFVAARSDAIRTLPRREWIDRVIDDAPGGPTGPS